MEKVEVQKHRSRKIIGKKPEKPKYRCGHDYNVRRRAKICQKCLRKLEQEDTLPCVKCEA